MRIPYGINFTIYCNQSNSIVIRIHPCQSGDIVCILATIIQTIVSIGGIDYFLVIRRRFHRSGVAVCICILWLIVVDKLLAKYIDFRPYIRYNKRVSAPFDLTAVDFGIPLVTDGADIAVSGRNQIDHGLAAVMLDRNMRRVSQAYTLVQRAIGRGYARLVDTGGLETLGYVRGKDYCTERLGVSLRHARELAWMERLLPQYPILEKAWMERALSRSKVRLLLRHVSPAQEAEWVEKAEGISVRRLTELLNALPVPAPADDAPDEGAEATGRFLRCQVTGEVWEKFQFVRELATGLLGREPTDAECLELCAAEMVNGPDLVPDEETKRRIAWEAEYRAWRAEEMLKRQASRLVLQGALEEQTNRWAYLGWEMPQVEVTADLSIPDDARAFEVDRRLRQAVRLSQHADWYLACMLYTFSNYRLAERAQFASFQHYVRERLGLSGSTARKLVRLRREFFFFPAVRDAYRQGKLTQTQAELVCRAASDETEVAWLEYAYVVSARQLQDDVRRLDAWRESKCMPHVLPPVPGDVLAEWQTVQLAERPVKTDVGRTPGGDVVPAPSQEARQMCAPLDPVGAPGAGLPGMPDIAALLALASDPIRLWQTCAPQVVEATGLAYTRMMARFGRAVCLPDDLPAPPSQAVATLSIWIPAELEDIIGRGLDGSRAALGVSASMGQCLGLMFDAFIATYGAEAIKAMKTHPIQSRDGFRCTVPTCSARANLDAHHVIFRSQGGTDEWFNQTSTCEAHHIRGVHAGRILVKGKAPHGLVWFLGLRPDGAPHQIYVGGLRWPEG